MRDRIKRITGSLYWRQFVLTAGMVLLLWLMVLVTMQDLTRFL